MKLSEMKVDKPKQEKQTTTQTIIKKIEVSREIKRLFQRIDRNLDKTWGLDNNFQGRKDKESEHFGHDKPKYRNLWEDWKSFRDWFEELNQ